MKSRNVVFTLILVIVAIGFALMRLHYEPRKREPFDRTPSHLVYTIHAMCRMDCRHISKEDIDEIMKKGIIIFNKSHMNDRPCPTYALQGYTLKKENLRVIFAQCEGTTKVVTCYNLREDFECDCTAYEKKNNH